MTAFTPDPLEAQRREHRALQTDAFRAAIERRERLREERLQEAIAADRSQRSPEEIAELQARLLVLQATL